MYLHLCVLSQNTAVHPTTSAVIIQWHKSSSGDHPALHSSLPRTWQERKAFTVKEPLFLHRIWNASWIHQLLDPCPGLARESFWKEMESVPIGTSPRLYSQCEEVDIGIQGLNSEALFPPTTPLRKPFPTKVHYLNCIVNNFNTLEDMLYKTPPPSVKSLMQFFLNGFSQGFPSHVRHMSS